ncbi:MAG: hypothetical protein LC789_03945, partial [Actinobacteria bacterium]|nr:hypothetical protein [Actinomycetota bacterium]
SGHIGTHGGGSTCGGCSWRLVPLCFFRIPTDPNSDVLCSAAVDSPRCADNQIAYAVYLSTPVKPGWDQVDVICQGGGAGLVPTGAVGPAIDTAFASLDLPDPTLVVQPPGGAVVRVPAIFRTAATPSRTVTTTAAAGPITASLTITATVDHYVWHFGDGTTRDTAGPGDTYTDGATVPPEGDGTPYVTHTYEHSGSYPVSVDVVWTGTYVFAGSISGTVQNPGPPQSSPTVPLTVSSARSQLVR